MPADFCRKGQIAASWPMRCLRIWVTSARMASSRVRERVDMKCVSWGKGDGTVAGAFVTRASLLQSSTLSSSPRPHRSGSASSEACIVLFGICLVLSYTYPDAFPSLLLGIVSSGASPSFLMEPTAPYPENAVLKPASQAPQLRHPLAGARHSICDRMIAYPKDAITDHQLRNGPRLRCCALSNCDAVGGEARFPRASIALFAAGWHSTICQTSMTTRHHVQ